MVPNHLNLSRVCWSRLCSAADPFSLRIQHHHSALVIIARLCTNLFLPYLQHLAILDPKFIRRAPEGFLYFQQRINGKWLDRSR